MAADSLRIVIIGSGNVATHLARGLHSVGCQIVAVCGRDIEHSHRLADNFDCCEAISDLRLMPTDADFYIIAVSDASIASVASAMPQVAGIVAHTSGSIPMDSLGHASARIGVLYPLQTFTREADVALVDVPFFLEASDTATLEALETLARKLSQHVYHADSDKRKTLHIAGVLSCNFVNYLWDCTSQVLAADGYDFSVVEPLVRATLDKAVKIGPYAAQTGPAMRCDLDVIRDHMNHLGPTMADMYGRLTQAIIEHHHLNCKI